MGLTKEQVARYSRQLILPEIGVKGQERLLGSSVVIIGAGGLGSPAALYLAAAGVGTIGIIDREIVEPSNLHRQVLHVSADIGRAKTASAKARLEAINPDIRVNAIQESLSAVNALEVLEPYDLVLDGSDNFPTRYLVNDACVMLEKPFVYAGVVHFGGQLMCIVPKHSACFRCVFPEPPVHGEIPSCQEAGVLGATVGIIGSLMAQEALKLLVGIGQPLVNRLLIVDGKLGCVREVSVQRDARCAVCGDNPAIRGLVMIDELNCEARLT